MRKCTGPAYKNIAHEDNREDQSLLTKWAYSCNMKLIKLTGKNGSIIGNYAMVDDEDYEMLNKYTWNAARDHDKDSIYVKNMKHKNRKYINISIHRLLLNITDPKIHVDHKDNNPLNNQRNNLRAATASQNGANRRQLSDTKYKYKGVRFISEIRNGVLYECWTAACVKDKKVYYGKKCTNKEEAAIEYNKLAIALHGEFALLNDIGNTKLQDYYMKLSEITIYPPDTDTHKRCRRCQIYKERHLFGAHRGIKDGKAACKECRKKEADEYYKSKQQSKQASKDIDHRIAGNGC